MLDGIAGTVFTLGDNVYDGNATLADYRACYGPGWGRHLDRTRPALGNHEYDGGTADGRFDYFGDRLGPRPQGWYSYDLGTWHVIVLNSNCSFVGGPPTPTTPRQTGFSPRSAPRTSKRPAHAPSGPPAQAG